MGASSSVVQARTSRHTEWSVDEVCHWLRSIWMNEFEGKFREANINGSKLLTMDGACCTPPVHRLPAHAILFSTCVPR